MGPESGITARNGYHPDYGERVAFALSAQPIRLPVIGLYFSGEQVIASGSHGRDKLFPGRCRPGSMYCHSDQTGTRAW